MTELSNQLLEALNELAAKLGGSVRIDSDRRLYVVYDSSGNEVYAQSSFEQVAVWIDFRVKFGIALEAVPVKRSRLYSKKRMVQDE